MNNLVTFIHDGNYVKSCGFRIVV